MGRGRDRARVHGRTSCRGPVPVGACVIGCQRIGGQTNDFAADARAHGQWRRRTIRCCPPKQKGRRCGPCPCRGICREDFPETTAQSSARINFQTIARVRYLPSESSDTAHWPSWPLDTPAKLSRHCLPSLTVPRLLCGYPVKSVPTLFRTEQPSE